MQRSGPGVVLAGAAAAQAAVSFVAVGLPAIGPELRHEFRLSLPALGAVLAASFFGSGLTLIAAGMAVDRFGSRPTILAGTIVGAAGLGAGAFAGSGLVLFFCFLASGLGAAVAPVGGVGALFRVYPAARRGWALGVRQMAVPLGGILAALLLPALDSLGGVRLPLLVAAAGVAVSGLAFAAVVPRDVASGAAKIARPLRTIARAPGMGRLLIVAALYIAVLQGVIAYSVPAARAAGLSTFAASATFFAVNLTAMVGRIVWGRIADREGGTRRSRTLVELGLVAGAGSVLFALALHGGAVEVIIAAVVLGFGALGWNAIVYVSAGERAGPELASRSFALAATVVFVLSAVLTPVLGQVAESFGWDALWLALAGSALLGALVSRTLSDVAVAA